MSLADIPLARINRVDDCAERYGFSFLFFCFWATPRPTGVTE
ncbi:hypothetical protein VC87395_003748 [Vibrio paracholerae 87395]|nr:hypothetical protein VC87395_003748 [Vibrio paracholerae 87395]